MRRESGKDVCRRAGLPLRHAIFVNPLIQDPAELNRLAGAIKNLRLSLDIQAGVASQHSAIA
jgi:hypothetical protein